MSGGAGKSDSAGGRATLWPGALAGRLAFLLAAFIILTTVGVVVREYRVGNQRLVAETERVLSSQAGVAADRLEAGLGDRLRLVVLWAQLETSQDLAVDDVDKRVSGSLEDLAATLADDTQAVAVRGSTVLASSNPEHLGDRPPPLPAFLSPVLRGPDDGIFLLAGADAGVVLATADVASLVDGSTLGRIAVWTPLSRFLRATIPLELASTELLDDRGNVLVRGERLSEGADTYLWATDVATTVAGPFQVRVGRPRAEVSAALRASGLQLITLASLFLLLALPSSVIVAHSGTSALRNLTNAARDLDARAPGPLPPVSRHAPAEVRVLAEAMDNMVERLERARDDLARSESLAAVGVLTKSLAHEIRTPLSVLRAGTEMLQRSPGADPRDREVSAMLQSEVERLSRLVDDLLVFGRTSAPVLRDADLFEVCGDAVAALDVEAGEKSVALVLEGASTPVRADPDQMRQILVNLITNGIRACQSGGTVRVAPSTEGGLAIVDVEDDGVGITADQIDEIWTPLVTTHRSGTGLGLPIVRQLVEAHGGRVEVRSEPGLGTRMRVLLPVKGLETT